MNLERHVTKCNVMTPWYQFGAFFLLWFFYAIAVRQFPQFFSFLCDANLDILVGILACGLITIFTYQFFLQGDIILTATGVETQSRIKYYSMAWKDCIQAVSTHYMDTQILILLKSGGSPMKERENKVWFLLRNPGRVIFLKDDELNRTFVVTYYGPLDFDLSSDTLE